jgi:hypothetical protein
MTEPTRPNKGYKCRNKWCQKRYTDVVGKQGWTQKDTLRGAECIPCLYAKQMVQQGITPERVQAETPTMVEAFETSLGPMGWRWSDIAESYKGAVLTTPEERAAW